MLVLGKLQLLSQTTDSMQRARKTTLRKCKWVTCECKSGFIFLHDIGIKQLKNLQFMRMGLSHVNMA